MILSHVLSNLEVRCEWFDHCASKSFIFVSWRIESVVIVHFPLELQREKQNGHRGIFDSSRYWLEYITIPGLFKTKLNLGFHLSCTLHTWWWKFKDGGWYRFMPQGGKMVYCGFPYAVNLCWLCWEYGFVTGAHLKWVTSKKAFLASFPFRSCPEYSKSMTGFLKSAILWQFWQ